jgi:hypothetical protein
MSICHFIGITEVSAVQIETMVIRTCIESLAVFSSCAASNFNFANFLSREEMTEEKILPDCHLDSSSSTALRPPDAKLATEVAVKPETPAAADSDVSSLNCPLCQLRIPNSDEELTLHLFAVHGKNVEILDLECVCLSCSCKHFGQKKYCKKSADLHPRQGNLLHRNIFTGLNKTSFHYTK